MKKTVKILGIILLSAFLLIPLKTNAQDAEWVQKLDLSDSISSSIIKVEDGVIIMQYEGTASENNLLIKYDFAGNKIWSIKNDYGYNISGVSDGFIIWNEHTMTKLDKDKNIIWQQTLSSELKGQSNANSTLIEISDGYIMYEKYSCYIKKIDKQGNFLYRKNTTDLLLPGQLLAATKTSDGNNIAFFANNKSESVGIYIFNNDLEKVTENFYEVDEIIYIDNNINKILPTDNGYLISGRYMTLLNNDGTSQKYDKITLDITEESGNYYAYEVQLAEDSSNYYNTAIVKYNKNLEEQSRIELPMTIYSESLSSTTGMTTSFSRLKNRIVYYANDNKVESIILNTPILTTDYGDYGVGIKNNSIVSGTFSMQNNLSYGVAKYRVSGDEQNNNTNNESNIINNIIKNPETSSLIIIIIFVLLVLIVSIVCYRIYKKKNK